MKNFFLQFFTWWNSQTLGTRFHTWKNGEFVGKDSSGNQYYRTKNRVKDHNLGRERRWVIYNGEAEASKIPPGWYGWIHHRTDLTPNEERYVPKDWELPHQPNQTGTDGAYRPKGSILWNKPETPQSYYQPWSPE